MTAASRRAVLGAIAVTPLIGLGATVAAPAQSSPAWDRALADYLSLDAAFDAAIDREGDMHEAYCRAAPALPRIMQSRYGGSTYDGMTIEQIRALWRRTRFLVIGPGCAYSDPGGCEHDGREREEGH